MLAKIVGILVIALGLGGVAAYYVHSDGHTCPLSGGASTSCPTSSACCHDTPCASESEACPTASETGCCPLSRGAAVAATPESVGPPAPTADEGK